MERREFLKYIGTGITSTIISPNAIFSSTTDNSLENKLAGLYKEVDSKFKLNNENVVLIDGKNQKMYLVNKGDDFKIKSEYDISTGKYGFGNKYGSGRTPTGIHLIKAKYHASEGNMTGRIIVLDGCEEKNKNTYSRRIYIHGTPDEELIGKPISHGCIRMKNKDIIELYSLVGLGTYVNIKESLV